jgi:hypothetical protein
MTSPHTSDLSSAYAVIAETVRQAKKAARENTTKTVKKELNEEL